MFQVDVPLLMIPYFLLVVNGAPSREQPGVEATSNRRNGQGFNAATRMDEQREGKPLPGRSARQAIDTRAGVEFIWPNGIVYYTLDKNLPSSTRAAFLDAVNFWQKNTCVKFKESASPRNHIRVVYGKGCNSNVGKLAQPKEQIMNLGKDCENAARHELAHAMGFWHTQMRPDNSKHIKVHLENVNLTKDDAEVNFETKPTLEINNFGLPYDYGSLMHYPADGFAKDNTIVISAKDPQYQYTMGNSVGSFIDILMMNKLYSCEVVCARAKPIKCANGGIPNPNACSTCLCPRGYGGRTCASPTPGACVGTYLSDGKRRSDTKTVGSKSGAFPEECAVHFIAPRGKEVELVLGAPNDVSNQCMYGCPYLGYEIITETKSLRRGRLHCCGFPQKIVSKGGRIALIMYSLYNNTFPFSHQAVTV